MPDYFEEEGSGQASGAHWSQSVEVILRSELGWTAEEINEQPLSKAFSDYFKWAENQGLVRLMREGEAKEGEANAALMAAAAKEVPIGS